jgi:hypothetical protein
MKWDYALTNGKSIKWHTVTANTEKEAQDKARDHADRNKERIYAGVLKTRE